MKKVLSILTFMAVFCSLSFAQSTPVNANNASSKILKNPTTVTAKIITNEVATPSNTASTVTANGVKFMKPFNAPEGSKLRVKELNGQADGKKQIGTLPSNLKRNGPN